MLDGGRRTIPNRERKMKTRYNIFIAVPKGMGNYGSENLWLGISDAFGLPEWIDLIERHGHTIRIFRDASGGLCMYETVA